MIHGYDWSTWLGCPKPKKEELKDQARYSQSYLCLTDIFIISSHCNSKLLQKPKLIPFCENVCQEFGRSLVDMSLKCAAFDDVNMDSEISNHRITAIDASENCQNIVDLPVYNLSSQCQEGVIDDSLNCGTA